MYHPIVKEQVIPGQLEGLQTNPDTIETASASQHDTSDIFFACGFRSQPRLSRRDCARSILDDSSLDSQPRF
jgi:hypothetical protein